MDQGSWRRLQNEELYDLYSLPNIIHLIKLRTKSWAGRVAHTGNRSIACRISVGELRREDHLEDPGVDVRIILKWILKK